MIRHLRIRSFKLFEFSAAFIVLLTLFSACNKKASDLGKVDPHDSEDPGNLDKPSPWDSVPAGGGTGGSGSGGSVTAADKTALTNLNKDFKDVEPDDADFDPLDGELRAQLESLLEQERKGLDVSAQKIALSSQLIQACASKIVKLAPRAGQPLIGNWGGTTCAFAGGKNGSGSGGFAFKVTDPYSIGEGKGTPPDAPRFYKVEGGTNGRMAAGENGSGGIEAAPWAGNVSDRGNGGRAAAGSVVNPQYQPIKGGFNPCTMGIGLMQSENPIPENYVTSIRKAGQCFRQALYLISPTFDKMTQGMDPQMANYIRTQMLGK